MLTAITEQQQAEILTAPRSPEAHRSIMERLPAMQALATDGDPTKAALPAEIGVAAWNLERCLFPEASADHLAPHGLDVILLSEVDWGMARTGQRNTTADMAERLGCTYAFGVEFYEMGLGGSRELKFCVDTYNHLGWHGNAILSTAPFLRNRLIRLDDDGHWFVAGEGRAANPEQPRVGGRMAIAAVIDTANGPICFVTVHLESNAGPEFRHQQAVVLLDAIDDFAPSIPVLIGGDLNTGNHAPPSYDWRDETLFELAIDRGYTWQLNSDGPTTRPSLISPDPAREMKLDWFASRDLEGQARPILPAVDANGRALSDHDCILCTISRKSL